MQHQKLNQKNPKPRTKEEARAFLRSIGALKQHRTIVGEEREHLMTMLKLVDSTETNNQHLWCRTWQIGNITYDHVTGNGVDSLLEVIDDDET